MARYLKVCQGTGGDTKLTEAKVYTFPPFGSRFKLRRKEKMKEKNLIETAKMQGNVMVRWLFVHLHDAVLNYFVSR